MEISLSHEEIDLLLTAIEMWRSDRYVSSDDWSDVDALEKRLEQLQNAPSNPVVHATGVTAVQNSDGQART